MVDTATATRRKDVTARPATSCPTSPEGLSKGTVRTSPTSLSGSPQFCDRKSKPILSSLLPFFFRRPASSMICTASKFQSKRHADRYWIMLGTVETMMLSISENRRAKSGSINCILCRRGVRDQASLRAAMPIPLLAESTLGEFAYRGLLTSLTLTMGVSSQRKYQRRYQAVFRLERGSTQTFGATGGQGSGRFRVARAVNPRYMPGFRAHFVSLYWAITKLSREIPSRSSNEFEDPC